MKTFNIILSVLKQMKDNQERKDFLKSVVSDKNISRDDLRRITCQTFIESNFVDNYFKPSFKEIVKSRLKILPKFFKNKLKKK
ncbi:hypothetical protein [Chryseobacterium sp. NFX27]|uniref:hypothetical protein n=1 Tax=Chryseobacterium sp. NFX27 TaxID=2819618 RepID=UPI003CF696D9